MKGILVFHCLTKTAFSKGSSSGGVFQFGNPLSRGAKSQNGEGKLTAIID